MPKAGDGQVEMIRSLGVARQTAMRARIQASSGKTTRHRLNRGGDRQANAALYRIVVVRLRWHQPTRDYMARQLTEGKSRKEVIRCLKRYAAREVFTALHQIGQDVATTAA